MAVEEKIAQAIRLAIQAASGEEVPEETIVLQKTRKDFEGDVTFVVFPFLKLLKRSPEESAGFLGKEVISRVEEVDSFNVVKGFLNISLKKSFWLDFLLTQSGSQDYGKAATISADKPVIVEYSSPNTNKPLHLGHIRNNLLGNSVARILEASGKQVVKVNLVNDRGIHICKSMLAWIKYGQGETPETSGKKGDKLVGDYYVRFETELRKQVQEVMNSRAITEEEARNTAPLMLEARDLLRKWEERDPEVIRVWEIMNTWVYRGFDSTYTRLGIDFDKIYYESDTYLLGRTIVLEGLKEGRLIKKADGSVWADLSDDNLDEKLLLRTDGTSVYITQDIGTAQLRHDEFKPEKMLYVVGNEQNYHFEVLKKVLKKLGKSWADTIHHLSYGMVELPDGKMKSREGTVVDADDLMDEMVETARRTTEELGKTTDFSETYKAVLYHTIAMGALKYFILKVDPRKNMLFNPAESIDFNGNTGPFIQYTHARIASMIRKAGPERMAQLRTDIHKHQIHPKEIALLKHIYNYPGMVREAAGELNPALIANFTYELCKEFNQFYHEFPVLNEPDRHISDFRLQLSAFTALCIRNAMELLGINVPERM
ncbi:MAG: arginine--tRNA ligase [Bacteroidales bacterium]|nr:arginine--tRNA ligase [Bacteroidales bacterium]